MPVRGFLIPTKIAPVLVRALLDNREKHARGHTPVRSTTARDHGHWRDSSSGFILRPRVKRNVALMGTRESHNHDYPDPWVYSRAGCMPVMSKKGDHVE